MSKVSPDEARRNFFQAVERQGGTAVGPYERSKVRVLVRCRNGHENQILPNSLVSRGATICKVCSGHSPQGAWAQYLQNLSNVGATDLEGRWMGSSTPHKVQCRNGHKTSVRPGNVRHQGVCRSCHFENSEAKFRERAEQLGLQVTGLWVDARTPIEVRCPSGHQHSVYPHSISQARSTSGCRSCAGHDSELAWEQFKKDVAELLGEVLEPSWLGSGAHHKVRCSQGHETTTRPGHVRQGTGMCRYCRGKIWDAFYVVQNPSTGVVKLGVTSGNPKRRLGQHAKDGYTDVLRVLKSLPQGDAYRLERDALSLLKLNGIHPVLRIEYFGPEALNHVLRLVDERDDYNRHPPVCH